MKHLKFLLFPFLAALVGLHFADDGGGTGDKDKPEGDDKDKPEGDDKDKPFGDPDAEGLDDTAREKIRKGNSEAANLRRRLKEAEAKATELDDLKKSQLSKEEQLTASNKELEGKVGETEARALRLEVALEAAPDDMSPREVAKYAKRISGNSKEELEADAKEFFADLAGPKEGDNGGDGVTRRPKERLRGGGDPTEEADETNPRKLAEAIPRSGF